MFDALKPGEDLVLVALQRAFDAADEARAEDTSNPRAKSEEGKESQAGW
ncbi:MAG TPA: hypothetical protein VFZ59_07855 [Verrucomicrobiae bacterium]|nr:hypothetical protein [Verrucomicrobiae bacterium]